MLDDVADILFVPSPPVQLVEKYFKCTTRATFATAFGSAYATATGMEEIVLMIVAILLSYKVGKAFKHDEDERTVAMHMMANEYIEKKEREKEERSSSVSDFQVCC